MTKVCLQQRNCFIITKSLKYTPEVDFLKLRLKYVLRHYKRFKDLPIKVCIVSIICY